MCILRAFYLFFCEAVVLVRQEVQKIQKYAVSPLPKQTKIWKNAFKRSKWNRDCDPFTLIRKTRLFVQIFHCQSVQTAKNSKK